MPIELCQKCKRLHYIPGDCPAPRQAQPVVAKIDPSRKQAIVKRTAAVIAEIAAPKKMGRPKTIADMKAYKAQKERERRAKLKAQGKTP